MTTKPVPSDIDIAQAATLQPIEAIAEKMGLSRSDIELYGDSMAKIKLESVEKLSARPNAKYVVVTAITPTPLGEGKSTTTVGLGQGMHHIGKTATIAIRQPSQGPTFGIKGGAAPLGRRGPCMAGCAPRVEPGACDLPQLAHPHNRIAFSASMTR